MHKFHLHKGGILNYHDILAQVSLDPKVAFVSEGINEPSEGCTAWGDHGGAYRCTSPSPCCHAGLSSAGPLLAG